ncbi:MAG: 2-C-methyl-D-erythritol 2,4-cyclodiphosphate synthase [Candidatus Dormibacteria bacterium]
MRPGIGFDIHRLVPGRRLMLGGVEVPHDFGLEGNSDADVVLHAVMDALLGAAGLGGIGRQFPVDDAHRDADSMVLLDTVVTRLGEVGLCPASVDATVIAEAPRLDGHVDEMRRAISRRLGLEPGLVNVKATSAEGMGAIGAREGIACLAVASVVAR